MKAVVALLPAPGASARETLAWVLADVDGGTLPERSGSGNADTLPPGMPAILVTPVQALSWHRIRMPRIAPARLRQALGGLLEDRLLDAPEHLSLAVSPGARGGAEAWTVACDRTWLAEHVARIEALGHPVLKVVPAFEPPAAAAPDGLPAPRFAFVGADEGGALVVRMDAQGVVALPLAAAPETWRHLVAESDTAASSAPAVARAAERWAGRSVAAEPPDAALLRAAASPWNLAQFDVVANGSGPWWQRALRAAERFRGAPQWRPVRVGLALLVVVQLIGLDLAAWRARQQLAATQQAQAALLTRTFPDTRLVMDAPLQMQRALAGLAQAAGESRMDDAAPLLQAAAATLPPDVRVTEIDYADGELTLVAPGLAARSGLADALRRLGYAATLHDDRLALHAGEAP